MRKSGPSSHSSKARRGASPNNADRPAERVGLIAGNGEFPLRFCDAARQLGLGVVAVAFAEETRRDLAAKTDEIHWVSIGQLGKILRIFRNAGVRRAFMAGQIRHRRLFSDLKLDFQAVTLLAGLKDKRADSILRAVADSLGRAGVDVQSSLPMLKEDVPGPGVLTRRRPNAAQRRDIDFGRAIAKHVAGADIGQTVVVKNQSVLAVEAMEGTDACLRRGGRFGKGNAVAVKVAKPDQDLRFDVPVIGPRTIRTLAGSGIAVMAFDAGLTLFIRRAETVSQADAAGIVLVGMTGD